MMNIDPLSIDETCLCLMVNILSLQVVKYFVLHCKSNIIKKENYPGKKKQLKIKVTGSGTGDQNNQLSMFRQLVFRQLYSVKLNVNLEKIVSFPLLLRAFCH